MKNKVYEEYTENWYGQKKKSAKSKYWIANRDFGNKNMLQDEIARYIQKYYYRMIKTFGEEDQNVKNLLYHGLKMNRYYYFKNDDRLDFLADIWLANRKIQEICTKKGWMELFTKLDSPIYGYIINVCRDFEIKKYNITNRMEEK